MRSSFISRRRGVVVAVIVLLSAGATFTTGTGAALDPTPVREAHRVRLPLAFEPNHGQVDESVTFLTRAPGYSLFLTTDGMVIAPKSHGEGETLPEAIRLSLANGAEETALIGADPLRGIVNYLIGNDPSAWVTKVPTYRRVRHEGVYSGIDLVYYSRDGVLEFDFEVSPGIDPSLIQLTVDGAVSFDLTEEGDLVLETADEPVTLTAPVTYQEVDGGRVAVDSRYVVEALDDGRQAIGFVLASYDPALPVVIDPRLIYSTYLGGPGLVNLDHAAAVGLNGGGAPFIAGTTDSRNFPTTPGSRQPRPNPRTEGFVTRLSRDGLSRVYSTYLGGSGDDAITDIAVLPGGAAFVVGSTTSRNFPVRSMPTDQAGIFQAALRGTSDGFVTQLNPSGTQILRATYLGGTGFEGIDGVKLGSGVLNNRLIVWGSTPSRNFPTTPGAPVRRYRGGQLDAFVTMFDRRDLSVLFSSFAGQNRKDLPEDLILNPLRGDMYLPMIQRADDFAPNPTPTTLRVAHFKPRVLQTASVELLQPLLQPSFFYDMLVQSLQEGIRILGFDFVPRDKVSQAYGPLISSPPPAPLGGPPGIGGLRLPFETAGAARQFRLAMMNSECLSAAPAAPCTDRLALVRFDEDLGVIDHTNFGGPTHSSFYRLTGFTSDKNNRVHIIGETTDNQMEVVDPVQAQRGGASDAYVTTFNPTSGTVTFNTYLGGAITDIPTDIAIDGGGNRWAVGYTLSADFPTTVGALQRNRKGRTDSFAVRISAN